MKSTTSIKTQKQEHIYLGNFVIAILFMYWIFCILKPRRLDSTEFISAWVIMVTMILFITGKMTATAIADGARVFGAQQIKLSLWREWLTQCLRSISIHFCLACISSVILLLVSPSTWTWSFTLAIYSIALAFGMLTVLTRKNQFSFSIFLAPLAFLFFLAFGLSWQTLNDIVHAYWLVHLPFILFAPCLILYILKTWETQKKIQTFRKINQNPSKIRISLFRFTHLISSPFYGYTNNSNQPINFKILPTALFFYCSFIYSILLLRKNKIELYNANINIFYIAILLIISTVFTRSLVLKNLQWRSLLLPGKFKSGEIGTTIFLSSLIFYALNIMGIIFFVKLLFWFVFDVKLTPSTNELFLYLIIFACLAFANSLGVIIFCLKHSTRIVFISIFTVAILTIICSSIMIFIFGLPLNQKIFSLNEWSIASLILITFINIRIANKMWTRQRLLAVFRENRVKYY